MNPEKKADYSKILLDLVPVSGESRGNSSLRDQLRRSIAAQGDEITDQEYWLLRDALIDQGLIERGLGRGGSVHRVSVEPEVTSRKEGELYEPFQQAIISGYVKETRIKRFISEITAVQGGRVTGGKWTRPDLTLIAVRTYSFTPGKRLEVITFEVKPSLDTAFDGIYEALAHSVVAHRSYLAVHVEQDTGEPIRDERIFSECGRLGIGYMTFADPADYDTFDIAHVAKHNEPDPYEVDSFITTQINAEKQEELREWLR